MKRGRPPHPLQWTRVKSLTLIKEQRLMVYEGSKDLKYDKSLKTIRKEATVFGGEFVFDPDSLKEEAKGFRVETSRLSQEELSDYAKLATKLRADFAKKAQTMGAVGGGVDAAEPVQLPASVMNLSRGCKKELSKRKKSSDELAYEVGVQSKLRRKSTKHSLSATQLQKIAKLVLEEGVSQVETAALCNVKPALVRNLVKTMRLSNHSYAALTEKREARQQKHERLK